MNEICKDRLIFDEKRLIKIPKKKIGEYRTIYSPTKKEKEILIETLSYLHKICYDFCNHNIVKGFTIGENPVSNARSHIGFNFTLSFDLRDFFDTVTLDHLKNIENKLNNDFSVFFVNNHIYQGLPTSPLIANLAAIELDNDIYNALKAAIDKFSYTRYADDLTISFDNYDQMEYIKTIVAESVIHNKFELNHRKTRLQSAKFGNRNITGISVGKDYITIPRTTKRRIRALKYITGKLQKKYITNNEAFFKNPFLIKDIIMGKKAKFNFPKSDHTRLLLNYLMQLMGLMEWAKLKIPYYNPFRINEIINTCYVLHHTSIKIHKKSYFNNCIISHIENLKNIFSSTSLFDKITIRKYIRLTNHYNRIYKTEKVFDSICDIVDKKVK